MPSSAHRSRLTWSGLFDRETIRAYATTKLLYLDHSDLVWGPKMSPDFVARYLLDRPHTENTPTNSNSSTLINHVVDELLEYGDRAETELLRYEYMKTLCHSISRQNGSIRIVSAIFPQTPHPVSSVEHRYHIFMAAIYLGKDSVVQHMLEDEQLDLEVKSEFFGTSLHAAVEMRKHDLVRTLLQRGANVNMEISFPQVLPLDVAIKNQDEESVRLLLEPQYGHLTSGKAFERAIERSFDTNQPRLAHLLFEHMSDKLSECRYLLSEGLRTACRRGLVEIVQLLLDHGGDVNEYLTCDRTCIRPSLLEQAIWTGQEEVMHLLLARGADPYGWEPKHCTSMHAAAYGGHVGAARILLDAGVKVESDQWMGILEIAADREGPAELVRLLLDRFNFDYHMLDDEPQQAESYVAHLIALACQRGNIGFVQAMAQHGVNVNDEGLYTRHGFPPLTTVAMAFRQDHIVRMLRELGAREVDPLDTIMGEDFASGKYPCDPPPPPERRLSWHD